MRLRALELIRATPGIYLCTLAERLDYRGFFSDGKPIYGTGQGATRWGGGYAAPLVRAGLVHKKNQPILGNGVRLLSKEPLNRTREQARYAFADAMLKARKE